MNMSFASSLLAIILTSTLNCKAWEPPFDQKTQDPLRVELDYFKIKHLYIELLQNVPSDYSGSKVILGETYTKKGNSYAEVQCDLLTYSANFPKNNKGLKLAYFGNQNLFRQFSPAMGRQFYGKIRGPHNVIEGHYSQDEVLLIFEGSVKTTADTTKASKATVVSAAVRCKKMAFELIAHEDGSKFIAGGVSPFFQLQDLFEAAQSKGILKITAEGDKS